MMNNKQINDFLKSLYEDNKGKLTWDEIAIIANDKLHTDLSRDACRKRVYRQLENINHALDKIKTSDVNTYKNSIIRSTAREETLKEIAHEFAEKMSCKPLLTNGNVNHKSNYGEQEALLLISDWHYGIEFDNYFNSYNIDIAKDRIQ